MGWQVHAIDVVTVFLNGEVKENIYLLPPQGVHLPEGMMWKIVRALYGLKQAPREWYRKLREWLLQWGYRISPFD